MQDTYMFQNRFGAMGGFGMGGRFGQNGFDMPSSAQYRQFHEMKAEMPSDVLELFKANEVGFLKAPVKPKCRPLDPISTMGINLMEMFQIPNLELMEQEKTQTKQQRIARLAKQKKEMNDHRIKLQIEQWNPFEDEKVKQFDPEKTLLVARLDYQTNEKTLKFEFEKYGIIKKVRIIKDSKGKSRGYGFVEFDSKDDFITAYKQANGKKIDKRRVVVDYEKGRTVLTWRPRRFGQGAGECRLTREELEKLQQERKQKKAEDNNKQKPDRHSRSRSPKREKRRDEYRDERNRERRSSRQRRDGRDGKRDNSRRDGRRDR